MASVPTIHIDSLIGYVSLEACGAKGDGVTPDDAAFDLALSKGIPFKGRADATYLITTSHTQTNKDVIFDGQGCKIKIAGDTQLLAAKASYTNTTNITLIDNTTTADLSNGTVALANEVTTLTVSSITGYAVGALVKIFSDDIISGADPADNQKIAEFARVSAIDVPNKKIQLFSRLRRSYTTSPRVSIHNESQRFSFKNCEIIGQTSPDPTWSKSYIDVIGFYQPSLENIKVSNLVERFVRLVSCYEPTTYDLSGKNIRTSVTYDAFGYLIHEVGCHQGRHYNPTGFDVRHVYSCSALGADNGSAFVENYGGTYGTVVIGGRGFNCKTAAFETHSDADDVTFIGCFAEYAYSGENGNPVNYGFRGRRTRAIDCVSVGGIGYNFFTDYGSPDNSRDHEAINCKHVANPNQTGGANGDLAGFQIVGQSGGQVTGIRITRPSVIQTSGSTPSFEATNGEMTIIEPWIKAAQTGAAVARIFEVNATATMIVRGGELDYTGTTGTQLRTGRMTSSSAVLLIDGLRINAVVSTWTALVQFVNVSATAYVKNIIANRTPSNVDGIIAGSGSPVYGVDYEVRTITNDLRSAARSTIAVTYSSGTTQTLDIDHRMSPVINVDVTTSAASIAINNISAGLFFGQEMIIRNLAASTNTLQVTTGANRINIGTNETIAIGRTLRLRWNGTDWVAN